MLTLSEDDLNADQRAAVMEPGNVFLIACPGSGKTRALTYKIALLLSGMQSKRKWVVTITYTHRAAEEIRERIERLGVDTSQLWIGTIHSLCLEWILRPYSIYLPTLQYGFSVIDPHDAENIISGLCKRYNIKRFSFNDCGYYYTPSGREIACRDPAKIQAVKAVLDEYESILLEHRLIDFEQMLRYSHDLVRNQPFVSKALGKLFSFILMDEYQDTKHIQYHIVASILKASGGDAGSFIVGDPSQAIYGTLGGYAIKAQEFCELSVTNFTEMTLSENYRSSSKIVGYYEAFKVHPCAINAMGDDRDYPSTISYDDATPPRCSD